jgi:hypothetical protein
MSGFNDNFNSEFNGPVGPTPPPTQLNERITGRITGIYLNAEPQPVAGLFKASTNNRVNLLPDLLQTDPTLNPGLPR